MPKRGNSEGSIYKRSDGRWTAALTLPEGGRRQLYGKTRKEVAIKLTAALRDREQGLPVPDGRHTVSQFLTAWLNTIQTNLRARTWESYELNARRLVVHIGGIRLASLTPALVQAAYAGLLERGLSRRSVEQAHTVLHKALSDAVRWGLLGRNPTDATIAPRPEKTEMKTLSSEQVQRLLQTTSDSRLHALWVVLVTTGLRLGEATGLKWADIDLREGSLVVQRALQRLKSVGFVLAEPKTSRSRRTIRLTSTGIEVLKEHRVSQIEERLQAGPAWQDFGLVFCRVDGRPFDRSMIRYALLDALKAADLPQIRVHDLRHTTATLLLTRGVHPKIVQDLLGHSTISLTLDTYSHVTPSLQNQAAIAMEAALSNGLLSPLLSNTQ